MEELDNLVQSICDNIDKINSMLDKRMSEMEQLLNDIDLAIAKCKNPNR